MKSFFILFFLILLVSCSGTSGKLSRFKFSEEPKKENIQTLGTSYNNYYDPQIQQVQEQKITDMQFNQVTNQQPINIIPQENKKINLNEQNSTFYEQIPPKQEQKTTIQQKVEDQKIVDKMQQNVVVPMKHYVQVGVFSNPDSIASMIDIVKSKTVYQTQLKNIGSLTKVRVGPFSSRQETEKAMIKLSEIGFEDYFIVME